MRLWLCAMYVVAVAAGAAVAMRRWNAAVTIPRTAAVIIPALHAWTNSATTLLSDSDDIVASSDPFRIARTPARVAYNPAADGGSAAGAVAAVAPPVRPTFTLKAIVGGPPWQAIVDGIPGQPNGTVVHAGSTFDRIAVRAVTRDSVVVQGPDTAWTLSFHRRP